MTRTTTKGHAQKSNRRLLVLQNGKAKRLAGRMGGYEKGRRDELYLAEIYRTNPPGRVHRAAIREGLDDCEPEAGSASAETTIISKLALDECRFQLVLVVREGRIAAAICG